MENLFPFILSNISLPNVGMDYKIELILDRHLKLPPGRIQSPPKKKEKRMEIYFDDLTLEAQMKLLEAFQTTPEEENWDVFPIAVIEREFVDEIVH